MPKGKFCTICRHPKRHQMEIGLTYKVPTTVLATRFGVSPDALQRHKRDHLSAQMRAAILTASKPTAVDLEALQVSESEGLLSQLIAQRARLQQHSEMALELGDIRSAVSCENAIVKNLELVAKLLGQLVVHHEVKRTSILVSADYLQVRGAIMNALAVHPEARRAVGAALHALEVETADDIKAAARQRANGRVPALIEAKPVDEEEEAKP
jgi:hypothetical protein